MSRAAVVPALEELLAGTPRAGVTAVLDAAERLRDQIEDAEYRASFAPPPTHYACCPCGSVTEIHGELDDDDYDAIRDWHADHADCDGDAS